MVRALTRCPSWASPLWGLSVASVVAVSSPARAQDSDARSDQGAVPSGISGAVINPPAPGEPPKKAVVVEPKLVHFENAPYPPEAEKAGLQAQVVLKLTIDVA